MTPSATKFINVIEAMSQWPENTTVVEVAGNALSLKSARQLAQELRASSTPTPAISPAPGATKPDQDNA